MKRQAGYTYLLLIFLVALLSAALAAAGDVWATTRQREKEIELIFAGDAIRLAIASYYNVGSAKQYPAQLSDLLKDPRFPETRRHLRQLYPDPFAPASAVAWIEIKAPQGGIMGVASASETAPLKRQGFPQVDQVFEERALLLKEKMRYRDWEFVYLPIQNPASTARH
ncbi:MAG: type II secretion system protein [Gallionellaceae bacterium]|jgi:type II secretory pathway pseudopilin PulG